MESIADLRRICQGTAKKDRSNWYMRHVSRFFSIYFTRLLLPTRATPNQVSFAMIVVGVLSTLFFLSTATNHFVIGAFLLQFWYILDCMDGEVARYRAYQKQGIEIKEKSELGLTGMYYDIINHYIINLLVPTTLAFGVYKQTGWDGWILVGLAAGTGQVLMLAMSHAEVATMISHLKKMTYVRVIQPDVAAVNQKSDQRMAHKIFSSLHYLMTYPTVMNLVLIAALFESLLRLAGARIILLLLLAAGSMLVTIVIISRKIHLRIIDQNFQDTFISEKS